MQVAVQGGFLSIQAAFPFTFIGILNSFYEVHRTSGRSLFGILTRQIAALIGFLFESRAAGR